MVRRECIVTKPFRSPVLSQSRKWGGSRAVALRAESLAFNPWDFEIFMKRGTRARKALSLRCLLSEARMEQCSAGWILLNEAASYVQYVSLVSTWALGVCFQCSLLGCFCPCLGFLGSCSSSDCKPRIPALLPNSHLALACACLLRMNICSHQPVRFQAAILKGTHSCSTPYSPHPSPLLPHPRSSPAQFLIPFCHPEHLCVHSHIIEMGVVITVISIIIMTCCPHTLHLTEHHKQKKTSSYPEELTM